MRLATKTIATVLLAFSLAPMAQANESSGRTQAEQACLTEAIYFEAAPSAASQQAVGHVILNRTRDPRFPGSVCGVVKQGCQFSYRCSGRSLALRDKVKRRGAEQAASAVLAGGGDPTSGALYFHSAKARPGGFFSKRPRVGVIGGNVFYR
ncbi:cell wall hydrolase [Amaricoccus sp.]|uniref:cell wall hydrolase n=1 Tax=Amaricoccus sp. TaxID=1872485 RepID=UPI001B4B17E7|nr:cell wall hydrolase [Amaricoccus sp.]MBP7002126.1 cell wall hydrolase [Amaricoccus sp.]